MKKKFKMKMQWKTLFSAAEDKRLSDGAYRLLIRVLSLSQLEGYCWANNAFFADKLGISKASASRRVNELQQCGYIRVEIDKMSGNKRHLIPLEQEGDSAQNCYDPIDKIEDTSAQLSSDSLGQGAATSLQELHEGIGIDAEHNNTERTKEDKRDGVEQSSVVLLTDKKNEDAPERANSESTQFALYSEATMDGLLRSGRRLSGMGLDEQVQVVIAFCRMLQEPMTNLSSYAKRVASHIRLGRSAEQLMHAIWHMHHTEFGRRHESKLNFLLGRNHQVRMDNALDNDVNTYEFEVSERLRIAALPFSALLEKELSSIQN